MKVITQGSGLCSLIYIDEMNSMCFVYEEELRIVVLASSIAIKN